MGQALVLGNDTMLVCIDRFARVRDLYFPHVGMESHVRGNRLHRVGVFVDGRVSWLGEDNEWKIGARSEDDTLAGDIAAVHPGLRVSIHFKDIVYNERAVFVREVRVTNDAKETREIKVYFAHQLEISGTHAADTAYFDPIRHGIVHYKSERAFMMGADIDGISFSDYTVGLANYEGKEGSHRDADDGVLSQNPIEHGPADSVIGVYATYSPGEEKTIHYFLVAATSIKEAVALYELVGKKTPAHIVKTTSDFWSAWLNKYQFNFYKLPPDVVALFRKSMLIVHAHADGEGGIIASGDGDILHQGKDSYAYVWPRDAAFAAVALDRAGDTNVARQFLLFCRRVIHEDGYFMHKYLPNTSLGSSWHPYIRDGKPQLPIQEDETALVLWTLYEHYQRSHDLELVEHLYNDVLRRAAEFMCTYRDARTQLPQPSYDVWEEKYGTSTFTSASVYGALRAAAYFAALLGKEKDAARYRSVAEEIRDGILKHLYDPHTGTFLKLIVNADGRKIVRDGTIDASSAYGVFLFGVLPPDDERLVRAMQQTEAVLSRGMRIGGIARYEHDKYWHAPSDTPGNPWVITTLWMAQYMLAQARTEQDLERVREKLSWAARYAQPSGILSEQLHPITGEQISAAPLVWSHAEFVNTVIVYLNRLRELRICTDGNPVP